MKNVYHTDGTPVAFFTAVFNAYKDEKGYITSSNCFQTSLGDTWREVAPDEEKAARVVKKIREVDPHAFQEIDLILRTPDDDKEQAAFEYLKLVLKYGKHTREKLTLSAVRRAMDLTSHVGTEVHRLHGFLRFQEGENGVFYAPCAPDNDVLELLLPHFIARFKKQSFVIHDVKRKIAALYNGDEWIIVPAEQAEITASESEKAILSLWKKYYHTVAIPMRKNTRQMKNYMPVRYWKFIVEKDGDDAD